MSELCNILFISTSSQYVYYNPLSSLPGCITGETSRLLLPACFLSTTRDQRSHPDYSSPENGFHRLPEEPIEAFPVVPVPSPANGAEAAMGTLRT